MRKFWDPFPNENDKVKLLLSDKNGRITHQFQPLKALFDAVPFVNLVIKLGKERLD